MTVSSDDRLAQFRARQSARPLRPYDELHSADRWHAGRASHAKAILAGDWEWKGRPRVSLRPPVDWDGLCASDRSWHLALHSWEPLAPLLAAYDRAGQPDCLQLALDLAADWLHRFTTTDESASPFAWYDLAVGARAYRLGFLLDVIARDGGRGDDLVALLLDGLLLHAEALADPERFASHSNHGFYQVIGQLAISRRFSDIPEAAEAGAQGRARLNGLLEAHFTSEGVHKEHSPHYHDLVLIPLRALRKARLIDDPSLEAVCERIESALAWFVTPAGRYAMFGDTSRQIVTLDHVDDLSSASLKFALSAGHTGVPPASCTRGFDESGYVVFRDRWMSDEGDFADCSYLAQTCAFHSRVHKHADDLSFVWYDRGCDILTDAGRFGYRGKTDPGSELFAQGFWYSDPQRVYVESTQAHNTVEIDGHSNPRRGVEPYGSALGQWGQQGAVRFVESQVFHGSLSHRRVLIFRPGLWLVIVDVLIEQAEKLHRFVQRFHLAPEISLINNHPGESRIVASLPVGGHLDAMPLLASQELVLPVRGESTPELVGWISPCDGVLEPQWTFGWSATGARSHVFASLLCLPERHSNVEPSRNSTDPDGTTMRLEWSMDGRAHLLDVERQAGKGLNIGYAEGAGQRNP